MAVLPLGRSVYLSQPDSIRALPDPVPGTPLFLSLHISEEMSSGYCAHAREVCRSLAEKGYHLIADVSKKTCTVFQQPDLAALAEDLKLYALRVDFGLELEEICALAAKLPLAVNASTIAPEDAQRIAASGREVFAVHNFYPRPETGLDRVQFDRKTAALRALGYRVFAFIPGDRDLRGPLHLGLPTLEAHRSCSPADAYISLCVRNACDGVILGDPGLSDGEAERIRLFREEGIITLPSSLDETTANFRNRDLTCREDSPASLIRVKESRVYSCPGASVEPKNCIPRNRGSITMDNDRYLRYSGEVMITRQDFPADEKVNVVGHIQEGSLRLLGLIGEGSVFRLI